MARATTMPYASDRTGKRLNPGDAVVITGGPYQPKSLPHRLLREKGVVETVYSGNNMVLVRFTGPSEWEKPRRFDGRALEKVEEN